MAVAVGLAPPALAQKAPELADYGDQFYTTDVGANRVPPLGRTRVLVVPVSFGDRSALDDPGFQSFYDDGTGQGFTFTNYWRAQSQGRFEPIPTVLDIVEFNGCPVAGNDDCQFSVRDLARIGEVVELFRAIFDRVIADDTVSLADFDSSGERQGVPDGWTDGILVVVPGWSGGVAPPVYPFMEVEEDDVKVGSVAIGRPDAELMLHEFGHNLGACDQYLWDFDHSLMSTCDSCSLDVHSRVALGWADVVDVPAGTQERYSLAPTLEGGPVLRIGDGSEYFLVERRSPFTLGRWTGDEGIDGLVVVHVDMGLEKPFLAQTDYDLWQPLLDVRHPTSRPDVTVFDLWDELLPHEAGDRPANSQSNRPADSNWYDGAASGIGVRCIVEDRTQRGPAQWSVLTAGPGALPPGAPLTACEDAGGGRPGSGGDTEEAGAGGEADGGSSGDSGCITGLAIPRSVLRRLLWRR